MAHPLHNLIINTNYQSAVPNGGFVRREPTLVVQPSLAPEISSPRPSQVSSTVIPSQQAIQQKAQPVESPSESKKAGKKKSRFDALLESLFGTGKKEEKKAETPKEQAKTPPASSQLPLKEQIKALLVLPDQDYSDKLLTSEMRNYIKSVEDSYTQTISDFKTHIAPSYWEAQVSQVNLSGIFGRSYYTQSYPSYLEALWTRDLMGLHGKWDMSFFLYPEDDSAIQTMLKRKSTQLKAELSDAMQKGITIDKDVEQQYRDVEMIREKLVTREERYFELSHYFTLYDPNQDQLKENGKKYEQKIGGYGIRVKHAIHRMDEGLVSSLPFCLDELGISRSSLTSSLAGSFPFISNDLVHKSGIFYGINLHTGGLVIFDRFNSKLPNMNSVILATSGAGKSFTVKLEVLRYLLNGIDAIIIDPENEYKQLCEAVGGSYINIATNSQQYINPFDIPPRIEDVEYGKGDLLRSQIMNLIGLVQILIGKMSAEEEAVLDKALQSTYALKGFSLEDDDFEGKQPPLMEDLMHVLDGMTGGEELSLKLSKFVNGTFGKLFNNYTNIDINNRITVFSIRDLEDALKTPAMFNALNFIWTKVRSVKKQRLLVCDEARILLQNDISANFLFGLTKRARKYGL